MTTPTPEANTPELVAVLAAHVQVSGFDEIGDWFSYACSCSATGDSDEWHREHVAAAVHVWLSSALLAPEVVEAAALAHYGRDPRWRADRPGDVRTALTAALSALSVQGEEAS